MTEYHEAVTRLHTKVSDGVLEDYWKREEMVRKYSFAIPTESVINTIKEYSPILEIGSGNGYWAYELSKAGVDVIATDKYKIEDNSYYKYAKNLEYWTKVEIIDGKEAVNKYKDRNLLMVWPCFGVDWAAEVLDDFKGAYFIYEGEFRNGCCANDRFFDILENKYKPIKCVNTLKWHSMRDYLIVYKRIT